MKGAKGWLLIRVFSRRGVRSCARKTGNLGREAGRLSGTPDYGIVSGVSSVSTLLPLGTGKTDDWSGWY